jgi:hypothetical protein
LTCNLNSPVPRNFSENYAASPTPRGVLSQDVFSFNMKDVQISNITFGCAHERCYKLPIA